MSLWSRLFRRRAETPAATEPAEELPEMSLVGWYTHLDEAVSASAWVMLKRLPVLVGKALGFAWRASKAATIAAIGLNTLAAAATTFGLLATQDVAGAVLASGPTWDKVTAALPALAVLAVAMGAKAGLGIAAGYAQARLKPVVTNVVETEFFAITTAVPLSAFDDEEFADDIQKSRDRGMSSAVQLVENTIDVITGMVGVTAVAVAVAVIHPLLLLLLVVAVIPVGWAAVRAARIQYQSFLTRVTRRRRLWTLEDAMTSRRAAAEVRAYQLDHVLLDQHQTMLTAEARADFDVLRRQTTTRIWGSLAAGIASFGVYGALGWLLVTGAVPLAAAAAAILALQQGTGSMRLLVTSINDTYDEGLYLADHTDLIARAKVHLPQQRNESTPAAPTATTINPVLIGESGPQTIALRDVSLRYPQANTDAISGVSLDIHHGETIALVGENGSGKSTLAKVIANLYTPTTGSITWDGTDIGDLDPTEMASKIGVIVQDYQLWPFSARAAIHIGRPDHTRNGHARVETAAKAAGAHEMILALPHGYDTILNPMFKQGTDLSGGQHQRIAAARGFYRDSPILICDEPSAALDPKAEHQLFEHLKTRAGCATTILITHRLANVIHADRIIVLHEGHQIETGTHNELMRTGDRYSTLFSLQASGYVTRN